MKGRIFRISRFTLNDGDGIRSTVFFSGCPLRCRWCHNPEGLDPAGGYETDVDDIVSEVRKDMSFYASSGGGVTLSGGEPTLQHEFCAELLRRLKEEGINTAVETSGCVSQKHFAEALRCADCVLFDFKHFDADKLKEFTGADAKVILGNLEHLAAIGKSTILRCPIIPGVNDTEEHVRAIAELAKRLPNVREVHLLPYHDFGCSKYEELPYTCYRYEIPDEKYMTDIRQKIETLSGKPIYYFN